MKLSKKILSTSLVLSLLTCSSSNVFALNSKSIPLKEEKNVTEFNMTNGREVNWWSVSWKILKAINNGINQYAYIAPVYDINTSFIKVGSGSVDFNKGEYGGILSHIVGVDSTSSEIDAWVERSGIDFFSKVNVGYYPPASGTPHSNKTISSGQHFILKPTKTGNWTVNFTSTESKRWSCWVIYDPLAPIKLPLPQKSINVQTGEEKNINIYKAQDMIYVLPSDDFKSFSNLNLRNSFISMNDLVNETYDLKNSHFIRMFKNYSIGDVIYFKDRIGNIEYCEEVNATKFTFNILDDTIDWYFKGDLTNIYNTGEDLSLKFKVVTEYADNNFEFETLDYLKNSINGYEDISQYLLKNNF